MPRLPRVRRIPDWSGFVADHRYPGPLHNDHLIVLTRTQRKGIPYCIDRGRPISVIRWLYQRRAGPLASNQRLRRNIWCPYPRCFSHWRPTYRFRSRTPAETYHSAYRRAAARIAGYMQGSPHPELLRITAFDVILDTGHP